MKADPRDPCDHGVSFPDDPETLRAISRHLSAIEVREAWPRRRGPCPKGCGFSGIAYASYAHYVYGDW